METPEMEQSAVQSPAQPKPFSLGWLWPAVTNEEQAIKASLTGAYAAAIVAVLTSALGITSLIIKEPILGISGWSLVDGILFAAIAWRISCFSFTWAVAGLGLYLSEMSWKWSRPNAPAPNVVLPILLTLCFVGSIRGTAFLRKG